VSVQGDFVEWLPNGDALVRDGLHLYRGRPIPRLAAAEREGCVLRLVTRPESA
jgi:hypothetical protein